MNTKSNITHKLDNVIILSFFFDRLTGAITRHDDLEKNFLLFIPGGSIHTFFMKKPIDIAFLNQSGKILDLHFDIHPRNIKFAPKGVAYTLEGQSGSMQNFKEEDIIEFKQV